MILLPFVLSLPVFEVDFYDFNLARNSLWNIVNI